MLCNRPIAAVAASWRLPRQRFVPPRKARLLDWLAPIGRLRARVFATTFRTLSPRSPTTGRSQRSPAGARAMALSTAGINTRAGGSYSQGIVLSTPGDYVVWFHREDALA